MPRYDYRCPKCACVSEEWMPIESLDMVRVPCPRCGATMVRQISAPAVIADQDWSGENGGRGRRILSLGTRDNPVYFRSLSEAKAFGRANDIPFET